MKNAKGTKQLASQPAGLASRGGGGKADRENAIANAGAGRAADLSGRKGEESRETCH